MACGCFGALLGFLLALFYLLVVWPIGTAIRFLEWIWNMIGYSPIFALLLIIGLAAIPWSRYHHKLQENGEYVMRCVIDPVWEEVVKPIFNLLRAGFNPLICWWNASNWFLFGYFNEVVAPAAIDCGIKDVIFNIGKVIARFMEDFFVGYFATGAFLTGPVDLTDFNSAMVDLFQSINDLLCCLCMDLCPFWCINMITGFGVIPNTWKTVEHAINAISAVLQVFWRLFIQLLSLTVPDPRPDFRVATEYLCLGAGTAVRASEEYLQKIWDKFVPWDLNFDRIFCTIDSLACIITDSANVLLIVFINIDIVAENIFGLAATSDIWRGQLRVDIIRILNSWAPVTDPDYFIDVSIYGRITIAECLCIFVRRIICDPTSTDTPCFNEGAATFLSNFDFCCMSTIIITTLNDLLTGLYDMFFNVTSSRAWFEWIDKQAPKHFKILKDNLVNISWCLLSIIEFVPVVGFCLKNIFVELVKFALCMIDFLLQTLIGLGTLPYFLIVLGENNFVTRPGEALAIFEGAFNALSGDKPDSFLNCVCYVLNFGLPIPPITLGDGGRIVPCGCEPVGFIPPTRKAKSIEDALEWSDDYMGYKFKRNALNRVTPIMYYDAEYEIKNGTWMNPIFLKKRILGNSHLYGARMIPEQMKNVDSFIDQKRNDMMNKWDKVKTCTANHNANQQLKKDNLWKWTMMNLHGELPVEEGCSMSQDFSKPGDLDRNRRILKQGYDVSVGVPKEDPFAGRNNEYYTKWAEIGYRNETGEYQERLVTSPPEPTLDGCPAPGEPLNPCFDLCCLIRASVKLITQILITLARIINGLIQGTFQDPSWSYFIGADCPNCFEEDIIATIVLLFEPFVCLCRFVNLFFPVSAFNPRPDLCCAISTLADLIGCILQVIVNGIKSLALDAPQFTYFNDGFFSHDVDVLFEITLGVVTCLCNFIRFVFPVSQLTQGAFDPCCIVENAALAIVEILRLGLQIIINLATIEGSGLAYFRGPALDNLGLIKQLDRVWDSFTGRPGGICNTGIGGLPECLCQLLNTIFPIRSRPSDPVSPTNCPVVDLCCTIREVAYLLNSLLRFFTRMLAGLWQRWPGGVPRTFLDFWFCNEYADDGGGLNCGKFDPILIAIDNLLSTCPCQFFGIVDTWLSSIGGGSFFNWMDCFCGRGQQGILRNISALFLALSRSIITLLRRLNDASYWQITRPDDETNFEKPDGAFIINTKNTWIFRFLAPSINAICNLISGMLCFMDSFLGLPCTHARRREVQSVVRWSFEIIIRVGAWLEGFVSIFAQGGPCEHEETDNFGVPIGESNRPCPSGGNAYGVSLNDLAELFVGIITFPIDALFTVSSILCKTGKTCPGSDRCCCYKESGDEFANRVYFRRNNKAGYQCTICLGTIEPDDDYPVAYATLFGYEQCDGSQLNHIRFRNCVIEGNTDPQVGCISKDSVTCNSNDPNDFLDGMVTGIFVYFRCMIASLFNGFVDSTGEPKPGVSPAVIFDGIIVLVAVVWQLSDAILRFFASVVLFFFFLFFAIGGGCECHRNGLAVKHGGLCYPCEEAKCQSKGGPNPNEVTCCRQSGRLQDNLGVPSNITMVNGRCFDPILGVQTSDTYWIGPCGPGGANPLVLCSFFQVGDAFLAVFTSFISIFTTGVVIPKPASRSRLGKPKREAIQTYKKRMHNKRDHYGQVYATSDALEGAMFGLFGYDVEDCFEDVRTCLCRNVDIPSVCTFDIETQMYNPPNITEAEVFAAVSEHMKGATVCDHVIHHCGAMAVDGMAWDDMGMADKCEYVDCIDRVVQGERFNHMSQWFPGDFFYSSDGPLKLYENIEHHVVEVVQSSKKMHEQMQTEYRQNRDGYSRKAVVKRHVKRRKDMIRWQIAMDPRWEGSAVGSFFVEIDEFEYKFTSGHYLRMFNDAYRNIRDGTWEVSMWPALQAIGDSSIHMGKTLQNIKWREGLDKIYRGVGATVDVVELIGRMGPGPFIQQLKKNLDNHPENVERRRKQLYTRIMVKESWKMSPAYKWFNEGGWENWNNPFSTFIEHITQVYRKHRQNWKKNDANFFTMDKHVSGVVEHVGKRWEKRWTPQKASNWEGLGRIFWSGYHQLWPGQINRDIHDRFIIDCNCRLVDGFVDQLVFLVNYCINDFMPNIPAFKRDELSQQSPFFRGIQQLASRDKRRDHHRVYIPEHIEKSLLPENDPSGTPEKWEGWYKWYMHRSLNWVRHKVKPARNRSRESRHTIWKSMGRQQWLRAVAGKPFHFIDWILCQIDKLFGTMISSELSMLIMDIEDWILNTNEDYMAGPVGATYWTLFWVRCSFKPRRGQLPSNAGINLNCSVGLGLESALGHVLWWSIIVFVLGSIVLPATMLPLIGLTALLFYLIVVPAIAYHYSPRCWLMTPSLILPGIGSVGITIPYFPFPIAFPALPECIFDSIFELFDKYITNDYTFLWGTNLEFLYPPYMINGDPAPPCPQKVVLTNCNDIGMADGISNLVYILNRWFPSLCMNVGALSTYWPFNNGTYLQDLFDRFKNASPVGEAQFNWCFYAMIPTLAWLFIIGILGIGFISVAWTSFILFASGLWAVILASPIMYLVPGSEQDAYEDILGSRGDGGNDPYVAVRISDIGNSIEENEKELKRRKAEGEKALRLLYSSTIAGKFDSMIGSVMAKFGRMFTKMKRD